MNHRQSLCVIVGTVFLFTVWELIGHLFLMTLPMDLRHAMSIVIDTGLALLIAAVSIHAIWRQQQELQQLLGLRDYLLRMQSHYLRLSPSAQKDPQQQLEYQALELQYIDVQERLASSTLKERVGALLGLAGLARTHLVYMEEPYPFFLRAVSHLAAALYLEPETVTRDQAMRSLGELAAFARDGDPRLLPLLIDNLAHANRAAYGALEYVLAARLSGKATVEDTDLKPLLPLLRFTASEETDMAVLRELISSPSCQKAMAAQRVLPASGKTSGRSEAPDLHLSLVAAAALRDTRDVLAQALRALPPPRDFPSIPAGRGYWKRAEPFSLQGCFLVGAELNKAQMQGIDLRRTALQAATLMDAQLQNCDLTDANLWKAYLVATSLQGAKLSGANLREASITAARRSWR